MSNDTGGSAKRLEIRKYANRRYYDSTHSRHLTLEEIRTLVEQGYDIRVVDAKTKADITGQVLIQIILELDTVKVESLPVPLLVHLIRVNDQFVRNFVDNYLYKALQAFTEYQKRWREQFRKAPGLPGAFPGMADWTQTIFHPFGVPEGAPKSSASAGEAESAGLREMVRQLQEQVSEMQRRFPGGAASRRRAPRARRARKK